MPSPESNRRNAQRSTGPRTRAGKAASRLNRLIHGAFSTRLLPGEDRKAYRALLNSFRKLYQPADAREEALVLRLVSTYWRLLRLEAMEGPFLRAHQEARESERFCLSMAVAKNLTGDLESALDLCESGRDAAEAPREWLPRAWLRDTQSGNAIFKMARYQTWLERSFYRALHELESLRSAHR